MPEIPNDDILRGRDRRLTAARADLAAEALEGEVGSARFVPGKPMQVNAAIIPMRPTPDPAESIDTVLLHGEGVDVYDSAEGWAWVQARRDDYVGYVPLAALSDGVTEATHTVSAPTTHLYRTESIKTEPVVSLWMTSLVAPKHVGGEFAEIADGLHMPIQHLSEIGEIEDDFVSVAEKLMHAPYVWAGKTAAGVDCSGLVQVAMARMGRDVPRDSDMQQTIGEAVDGSGRLQRGDLLFWKGHVAIMVDPAEIIHATAHSMTVIREPVNHVRRRIENDLGLPLLAVRRP